jgi:hypothetical protein
LVVIRLVWVLGKEAASESTPLLFSSILRDSRKS